MKQSDISKQELLDLYEEHKSLAAVARELGCSPKFVAKAMKKYDLIYEKVPRKYGVNHHFFAEGQEVTEATMYLAGFLAANGNVMRQSSGQCAYRIESNMAAKDKPFLSMLAEVLKSEAPIGLFWIKIRGNSYQKVRFLISSKYMVDDLKRYNIVPKKKNIYAMPKWVIDHKLVRHFLRGWVDGLGGFYKTDGKYQFRTRGTIRFLEQLREIIDRDLKLFDPEREISMTTSSLGTIRYVDEEDVKKIADYLYGDASISMERKKNAALFGTPLDAGESDSAFDETA